jgi:hypothetical protein
LAAWSDACELRRLTSARLTAGSLVLEVEAAKTGKGKEGSTEEDDAEAKLRD